MLESAVSGTLQEAVSTRSHLSQATLPAFATRVDVPTYDRAALRPAIVHIGVGGFHRAHQAVYLDSLARLGDNQWGEVGVGLRSAGMKEALEPQDWLFTVVERGEHGDTARVVGSMCRYLFAPDDPAAVLDVLTDERTRIVTLTVTGGGYNLDEHGRFRAHEADVVADLRSPATPTTLFGYLATALDRRRAAGLPGFTILACDNLPDSGAAARTAVVSYARLSNEVLATWIERNVTFPCSMVDRITPRTDDALRRLVHDQFGIQDRWPVAAEPFAQWVIEDDFCNGRPPLERVGVRFVDDVTPYQLIKSRLLNGSHCAMAYLGHLAGHDTTSEVMSDPLFFSYLQSLMRDEIAPLLPRVPGVDLDDYQRSLLQRFANPRIGDAVARLCGRGSTKMAAYLLPSLAEARSRGLAAPLLTLAVAGWFRYLRATDIAGEPIEVQDARSDTLQRLALAGGTDPRPLLGERTVMGSLGEDETLCRNLERGLRDLDAHGVHAVIRAQLALRPAGELMAGRARRPLHSVRRGKMSLRPGLAGRAPGLTSSEDGEREPR